MKVSFLTPDSILDTVKSDYANLKLKCTLPCDIEEEFSTLITPRFPDEIAASFYGKNEIETKLPIIEINLRYTEKSENQRQLILLHEIIHVCQRTNELKTLNSNLIVSLTNTLNRIVNIYRTKHGSTDFQLFTDLVKSVSSFTTMFFEITNELYLKQNYPKFCEEHWISTYQTISPQYSSNVYSDFDDWAKYLIFTQLVRASFMRKISEEYPISSDFQDLENKWESRLQETIGNEEFALLDLYPSLIDVDDSNSNFLTNLSKSYAVGTEAMLYPLKQYIL